MGSFPDREKDFAPLPLRVNMAETLSVVLIREQGEKEDQHDKQEDRRHLYRDESTTRPNPEVVAKAKRRRFTGAYKQRILTEADAAKLTGTLGALLRREHLYSSILVTWRRDRDAGILEGLTPAKRGPKSKQNPLDAEVDKLRRQNARLTEDLRKAGIIIDVQKKLATLLETLASQEEAAGKRA